MQFSFGQMQFSGFTRPWYLQGTMGGVDPITWLHWLKDKYFIKTPQTFDRVQTFERDSAAKGVSLDGTLVNYLPNDERLEYSTGTKGLLIELTRANLFVDSDVPATQDITTTAIPYTLSFYGTGSIVLSGAHSATLAGTGANERVDVTFTPSAGVLTLTLSGTITYTNFEEGSFPTSFIEGD